MTRLMSEMPRSAQFGDHVRVLAKRRVDLVELVDGEVRRDVGNVLEREDGIAGEVDRRFVGLVVGAVPHHRERVPGHRVADAPGQHLLLGRFHQFDRCEAEGVGDMPIATQDLGCASELVRTQWFQRVLMSWPTVLSRRATPTADAGELVGSGQRARASRRAWTTVGAMRRYPQEAVVNGIKSQVLMCEGRPG